MSATADMSTLTDAELEDAILGGEGDDDYRLALLTEYERRALDGAPPEPAPNALSAYDADEWEDPNGDH